MNNYKVDFHIHTNASDGKASPMEIVMQAKELGYDAIAITDHDNTNGLCEALFVADMYDMNVIPGIEIAVATEENIELHMLGYYIDRRDKGLRKFLETIIDNRRTRNKQLFRALQRMGYDISEEDVASGANDFIGKPLIARALVRKGYIKNEIDAFGPDILGSGLCTSIKKVKPLAKDAISIIRKAGGTPVLAHPIQTRGIGRKGSIEFYQNIEQIIKILRDQGLMGLECYHPDQNMWESMKFEQIAEKYGLQKTKGSDFHGANLKDAELTALER